MIIALLSIFVYLCMYVCGSVCMHAWWVLVLWNLFVGSCFVCVIYYDFIVYYCGLVLNSFKNMHFSFL
jgi:hypothetical protein